MQGSKCHYFHICGERVRVSEEPKKEPPRASPGLKWFPWSLETLREVLQHFDEAISDPHKMKIIFQNCLESLIFNFFQTNLVL